MEWRAQRLLVGGRVRPISTPHLVANLDDHDEAIDEQRWRGVADGLGMLVRHSDFELHQQLSPRPFLERIVFDGLEQLRCDSLTAPHLRGQRANLDAAFDAWSSDAQAQRVGESRTSLLVFTLLHMAHGRLTGRTLSEAVDELTEATRFHLAPVIGHALRELAANRFDQRAFAIPALEIARLVAEVAGDAADDDVTDAATRHRLAIPAEWVDQSSDEHNVDPTGAAAFHSGANAPSDALHFDGIGDYCVFTTEFDQVVSGTDLQRRAKLDEVRRHLDQLVAAQAVSAPRLAARLLAQFSSPEADGWSFGHDAGVLDGRRLGQLVANPRNHELFKHARLEPTSHTAVTFLVDNSGSMKRQRHEAIAVLLDTMSRALDLAEITHEVLGFTTGGWAGGRAIDQWRAAGEPERPGRMNETLNVVYKAADESWRRSRPSLAALASPHHFREGLDGEALIWAHARLTARPEPRKVLVMITDGSPTDSATSNLNRTGFLDEHLAGVADRIERHHRRTGRGVELGAINVDRDAEQHAIRRSVGLDLSGTLTLGHYMTFERLVGR